MRTACLHSEDPVCNEGSGWDDSDDPDVGEKGNCQRCSCKLEEKDKEEASGRRGLPRPIPPLVLNRLACCTRGSSSL